MCTKGEPAKYRLINRVGSPYSVENLAGRSFLTKTDIRDTLAFADLAVSLGLSTCVDDPEYGAKKRLTSFTSL